MQYLQIQRGNTGIGNNKCLFSLNVLGDIGCSQLPRPYVDRITSVTEIYVKGDSTGCAILSNGLAINCAHEAVGL